MITQAGPRCDVCGEYILLDKSCNPFSLKGIKQTIHCHDKCRIFIEGQTDWKQLPQGPLRTVFEEAESEMEEKIESSDLEDQFETAMNMPELKR